jgi:predicted dehydrogenase
LTFKLGASGLGHWVRRLQSTLSDIGDEIELYKAVGTKGYEARREELQRYGISRDRYFSLEPDSPLPSAFFEGLDIVYIASPNRFHMAQTLQAVEMGKVTVTEKTLAVKKDDFYATLDRIRKQAPGRVTVGLHYITKSLTLELGRRLPRLIDEFGRIKSVSATFFEETRDEDANRRWLFKPENGGVAMDWIHPLSIISYTLKAEKMRLEGVDTFIVQPLYDQVNPTAFQASYELKGTNFLNTARAVIRVGKGMKSPHKVMRLNLERATVDLVYISTDEEFLTGKRGELRVESPGGGLHVVRPSGPLSYEPMIQDMLKMVKGGNPTLSLQDLERIYDPEWQLQEGIAKKEPSTDKERISWFMERGLANQLD